MKILVSYRGIPQSPGWATGDMVVRAFKALGHEAVPYGNYYQTQRRLENRNVLTEDWDLFLFMECGDGDPVYTELNSIRARKRASWFFDAALYPHNWIRIIQDFDFDVNFIANSTMLYDNLKTEYLPYAADDTLHYRQECTKKRRIGFVGSDRPERRQLASRLGIELKSNIFREEYIDYLATSTFSLNDIAGGGNGLIAMRPFEAIMAGSTLITPKGDGVKSLGLPCIEYSSVEELETLELVPDFNGQDFVLSHHTYRHRCATILEKLFPYERV